MRGRPGYPAEAVAWWRDALGLAPGRRVLELAAGTGKLSEALVAQIRREDLVALEPVPGMRRQFAHQLPDVELLDGRAEAIPLADASVAAVVAGQAFHWFDADAALSEIHRVLASGGHLGLIWNANETRVGWIRELRDLIDAERGEAPAYATGAWKRAFETTRLFEPIGVREFAHVVRSSVDAIVDRVASISYIAALAEPRHREVCAAVRQLLREHPETRGQVELDFPYRVDTFAWRRRS